MKEVNPSKLTIYASRKEAVISHSNADNQVDLADFQRHCDH